MKPILIVCLSLLYGINIMAQEKQKAISPNFHPFLTQTTSSPELKVKSLSFISTPIQTDVSFNPILVSPKSPNHSDDMEDLLRIKRAQQIIKDNSKDAKVGNDNDDVREITFEIGEGFYADLDYGCPNDNTIAVSDGGRIMSMMNGHVGIFTTNGTKLNVYSLEAFFNYQVSDPCDPKVEYDPVSDRFFMFVQACGSSKDNVAMAFSKTNDPNGSWNTYLFDSDALGDGSWSDYPKIAITRDEVFVSLNLFEQAGSGSFRQSIVYQLDKYDGYSGNSLSYKIWDDFPNTTLIVRSGVGQYGPGAYMINTSFSGDNKIVLTDITGNLSDNDSQKKTFTIPVDVYSVPASASQPNSSYKLDTGDNRIQDGYYQNGIIHFVYSVSDQAYGAIRYHRLDPTILDGNNYHLTTAVGERDYAYPSISPFTTNIEDQTSIVHFAVSGPDRTAQMRAKVFNDDFSTQHSGYIYDNLGAVESSCYDSNRGYCRWGDYSGIAIKYNEAQPTVWVAGSVVGSGSWWTYIAELKAIGNSTSTDNITDKSSKIFPVPASSYLTVYIESDRREPAHFSIIDIQGRMVSSLYSGVLKSGENRFTFDTSTMGSGTYFLTIKNDDNEIIKTEKIIINN